MLEASDLPSFDPRDLPPEAAALVSRLSEQLAAQQRLLEAKDRELAERRREIVWRDARLEKLQFELARLKRWRFGARTEAMSAELGSSRAGASARAARHCV